MKKLLFILLFIGLIPVQAQTCGFGCLGLSGIYGGYTFQEFDNKSLNERLQFHWSNTNIPPQELDFSKIQGFRVGANIIKAQFSYISFGIKGFYQFMKANKEFELFVNSDKVRENYKMDLSYWGLGVDFGFALLRDVIDIKLVDAGVTLHQPTFTWSSYIANVQQFEYKYVAEDIQLNYYAGSGLILHIVPDYISLEGTAFISFFELDNLQNEESGEGLLLTQEQLVKKTETINYSLQLNLGFPL